MTYDVANSYRNVSLSSFVARTPCLRYEVNSKASLEPPPSLRFEVRARCVARQLPHHSACASVGSSRAWDFRIAHWPRRIVTISIDMSLPWCNLSSSPEFGQSSHLQLRWKVRALAPELRSSPWTASRGDAGESFACTSTTEAQA